jgi:hypothetical protein
VPRKKSTKMMICRLRFKRQCSLLTSAAKMIIIKYVDESSQFGQTMTADFDLFPFLASGCDLKSSHFC